MNTNRDERYLNMFREIAAKCSEAECLELIEDCEDSYDDFIKGPVKQLYEKRLAFLRDREVEVEYYESKYENN